MLVYMCILALPVYWRIYYPHYGCFYCCTLICYAHNWGQFTNWL